MTKTERENQVLLAIYKETNGDPYNDPIQKIVKQWRGGIFQNDYKFILRKLHTHGLINMTEEPRKTGLETVFTEVILTNEGKEKCEKLLGKTEKLISAQKSKNEIKKNRLEDLIAKNKIEEVIRELRISENKVEAKEVILLSNRYNALCQKEHSGTISNEQSLLERNQIIKALLNYVENV